MRACDAGYLPREQVSGARHSPDERPMLSAKRACAVGNGACGGHMRGMRMSKAFGHMAGRFVLLDAGLLISCQKSDMWALGYCECGVF